MRAALVLTLAACGGVPGPFRCPTDQACGAGGVCEPEGYCSFPDETCASGRRFDESAGGGAGGRCTSDLQVLCSDQIAAGADHTCARMGASVVCVGANNLGQLGDGSTGAPKAMPTLVATPESLASVSAGRQHSCVLTDEAGAACFGANASGQLGNGTQTSSPAPAGVLLPAGLAVSAVTAGRDHSCAIVAGGRVHCWGSNAQGQLGDGTQVDSPLPIAVSLPAPAMGLALGWLHTCAALDDGALWCWGDNLESQLGLPGTLRVNPPGQVPNLGAVVEVVAGAAHTCARTGDGAVSCWGLGLNGRLGLGDVSSRASPVLVPELEATALSAGDAFTCALRDDDDTVVCFGRNQERQLGDGTTTERHVPTPALGLDGVLSLSAGAEHACARRTRGAVWCWGSNLSQRAGIDASGGLHATPMPTTFECP
jgi:alpha-tubulin suppressor-like RCC1 family protein